MIAKCFLIVKSGFCLIVRFISRLRRLTDERMLSAILRASRNILSLNLLGVATALQCPVGCWAHEQVVAVLDGLKVANGFAFHANLPRPFFLLRLGSHV